MIRAHDYLCVCRLDDDTPNENCPVHGWGDCGHCAGTGEGHYDGAKCLVCKGWGELPPAREEDEDERY